VKFGNLLAHFPINQPINQSINQSIPHFERECQPSFSKTKNAKKFVTLGMVDLVTESDWVMPCCHGILP
jgi:hypothetical protein